MKTLHKKIGIWNVLIAGLLIVLWASVFWFQGLFGAVSWGLLKLVLPFVGVVLLLFFLIVLIIKLRRKHSIQRSLLSLLLSALMEFPLLLTLNVIPYAYPAKPDSLSPAVTVKWPLKERTTVGWGGDTPTVNLPHVTWASERWAYDLVMEPYNTGDPKLESYGIWNREVLAPVSGTVVAAYDDEDDIAPNTEDFQSSEGNHVYIRIEKTGTYLLLNHLKKGSVTVNVGDQVNPGDVLGRVGNSGSTSEPHLHIHHQRQDPTQTIYPIFAEGLPLYFEGIDAGPMPEKGTVVTPSR
ncbi:M23 family metallopeptidase [Gorillibacterium sp. CAU 1737]|uniref:M23 family metallopeptidase n=1 Tax=Gorillibacterium sp. CAU 1737 TaxID=3140362 RepID=UPI003260443B